MAVDDEPEEEVEAQRSGCACSAQCLRAGARQSVVSAGKQAQLVFLGGGATAPGRPEGVCQAVGAPTAAEAAVNVWL